MFLKPQEKAEKHIFVSWAGILRDKIIDVKLMYTPKDDKNKITPYLNYKLNIGWKVWNLIVSSMDPSIKVVSSFFFHNSMKKYSSSQHMHIRGD